MVFNPVAILSNIIPGLRVEIPVDYEVRPVRQPWQKTSICLQCAVQDKIQELMNRKIVELVMSTMDERAL